MLARRRVDICCVQEVQYKNEGTTVFGSGEEKYKFWWSGEKERAGGVGVLVKEDLIENIIEVVRVTSRIMKISIVIGKKVGHIFSVYAPQVGRPQEEKEAFWGRLDDEAGKVASESIVVVGGDLNGHVGRRREGFEEVMGMHGSGERNNEGEKILEFCQSRGMKVTSTYFRKDREKKITYKSGGAETQIDYILLKWNEEMKVKDCKVIPGEACLTQHRLLCLDAIVKEVKRQTKRKETKKIKVWKLREERTRQEFEENVKRRNQNSRGGWSQLKENITEAGKEVCGITSGHRKKERETWWWNTVVQEAIKEKKAAYRKWQKSKVEEDKQFYQEKKRQAKREVAKAQRESWEEWSREKETLDLKKEMFKIAKQMKKEKKDVVGAKYIKEEQGNIMVDEKEIMERWRRYFRGLLNEENDHNIEEVVMVEGPVERIKEEEVELALKNMKKGRAPGPTGVTSELLRGAGKEGVKELTRIFNEIFENGEIPEDWKGSYTVPIYKGKGDALQCGKYRGVRLLEHGMKVYEKILEGRLRKSIVIDNCQMGFCPGRSTTEAIFIIRQLQEKYCQKKKKLYHIFVDLEKAFDRVPRTMIEWALRKQRVPQRLVTAVMALYQGTKSKVKALAGESDEFEIGVGVHQGSALSPLLFITVMQEATKEARGEGPWELLYADDLVLTAETLEEVRDMFNRWKAGMEQRGLKINMEKTKLMVSGKPANTRVESGRWPCSGCGRGVGVNSILCMRCNRWCHRRCTGLRNLRGMQNFICPTCRMGQRNQENDRENLVVDGGELEEVEQFCYLGDMIDCEAGVERTVRMRVAAAWSKWREMSSLLTNHSIPLKSRAGVYEACIRSVLLYGSETWAINERHSVILRSCDRKMLRYIAGVRWQDQVGSGEVAERCGVKELEVRLRQGRLRWFGHVRRAEHSMMRRVEEMEVGGRRPVGRPKKTWRRCIQQDMDQLGVNEGLVQDRREWRRVIARPTPG